MKIFKKYIYVINNDSLCIVRYYVNIYYKFCRFSRDTNSIFELKQIIKMFGLNLI